MLRILLSEKRRLRFLEKRDGKERTKEFAINCIGIYGSFIQSHEHAVSNEAMCAIMLMHYRYAGLHK